MTTSLGTYSGVDVDLDELDDYGWAEGVSVGDVTWPRFLAYFAALLAAVDDATWTEAKMLGTSATSLSRATGAVSCTASTGKKWQPGSVVVFYRTSDPTVVLRVNVLTYNSDTGAFTGYCSSVSGSGTPFSDWTISG